MNALWLLILALSFSPAEASWQDYVPHESTLEKARNWVLDHTGPSVHLFLFEHLPRLFPVTFICKLQSGAEGRTVLPREPELTAAPGAELFCPGVARITLKSKATLRINYDQELPVIELKSGSADIVPESADFFLRSGESSLKIRKAEGHPTLKLQVGEENTFLYTDQGNLEGTIAASGTKPKFFMGTLRGRIGLQAAFFEGTKYIFAQELLAPLDLALSRSQLGDISNLVRAWEKLGIKPVANGVGLFLGWALPFPKAPAQEGIEITLNGPAGPLKCQLFSRSAESKEFVKAYDFPASHLEQTFRVKLHPDYAKYFLNVGCTDEAKNTIFSNDLPPPAPAFAPDKK